MKRVIPYVVGFFFGAAVALIGMTVEILRRRRLRIYWSRACAGREWRQAFPDADKDEIRKFLQLFVDAFAFRGSRRLQFRPSDKILDIYRACYPEPALGDSLETESFMLAVEKTYHFDIIREWNPEITLGQVFAMALEHAHPSCSE